MDYPRRVVAHHVVSNWNPASHVHKAGPMKSGGIHDCTEKGCGAHKVNGRWVEAT